MSASDSRRTGVVLGAHIDACGLDSFSERVMEWAAAGQSRYVCICNVHSVVTAKRDPAFRRVINEADAATADGMPLVWSLRAQGFASQQRMSGPDLTSHLCELAARRGVPIFFYGASPTTLAHLCGRLRAAHPGLRIAGSYSPPFRALTDEEEAMVRNTIVKSGARIVFVGLGCPKQEQWMARQRGHLPAVMLGVGAAFDFHAGVVRRAPRFMQNAGLEWLFRLLCEPRRLWRRYLVTNTQFVYYSLRQRFSGRMT